MSLRNGFKAAPTWKRRDEHKPTGFVLLNFKCERGCLQIIRDYENSETSKAVRPTIEAKPVSDPISEDRTPMDWEARFKDDDAPWERGGVHPAVAHWIAAGALAPGLSVYVPGCGRGLEPAHLSEAGLEVTASDLAPSAVAYQRQALEGFANATALEANGLSWRPDAPFDRLYEQTFLCAIHPRDREAYAQMAFEVLKPGGQLLALFMQKDERGGPPYGCSIPAMKTLFSEARWIWPEAESLTPFPHPRLNDKAELASVLTRR